MRTSPSTTTLFRFTAPLALVLLVACGDGAPDEDATTGTAEAPALGTPAPQAPAPAPQVPTDPTGMNLANANEPLPGLITSAQPNRNQVESLMDVGYTHFISLRPADEEGAGWEELTFRGEDATFTRIPVAGGAGLTRENVEALDRALAAAGDEPTLLYCSSSNRVGALLALRAYWLKGATADEALALGRAAGLAALEPQVRELLGGS